MCDVSKGRGGGGGGGSPEKGTYDVISWTKSICEASLNIRSKTNYNINQFKTDLREIPCRVLHLLFQNI